jgi:alkylation response protein AidB-like acyl-CoA dehydrogenase
MTLLGFERGRDKGREASLEKALSVVVSSIGESPSAVDLERLGTLAAWSYAYRQGSVEAGEIAAAGGPLGVIPNVLKLLWSEYLHKIYEEVWRIQGEAAETIEGSDAFGPWTGWVREYWHARASKIFAGTNQIQKNIIAEAGLGLPKEIQYWGKRGDSK